MWPQGKALWDPVLTLFYVPFVAVTSHNGIPNAGDTLATERSAESGALESCFKQMLRETAQILCSSDGYTCVWVGQCPSPENEFMFLARTRDTYMYYIHDSRAQIHKCLPAALERCSIACGSVLELKKENSPILTASYFCIYILAIHTNNNTLIKIGHWSTGA